MTELPDGERVEADDGYVGEARRHIKCPSSFTNTKDTEFIQQRVCNHQETVNRRFKNWSLLKQVYRHDITLHGDVFRAIVITILDYRSGL